MSDLVEIYEKCFPFEFRDYEYKVKKDTMYNWLVKDNVIDLHKLCMMLSYYVKNMKRVNDIEQIADIILDAGIIANNNVPLSQIYNIFYDDDLVKFYENKFKQLSYYTYYTLIIKDYEEYLGFNPSPWINTFINSCEITNMQQLNFIVNISSSDRYRRAERSYLKETRYIGIFITARKMGYDKSLILERFGITEEEYNIVSTQEYYNYVLKSRQHIYDKYITEQPEREFITAAVSFIDVLSNGLEVLGTEDIVVSGTLIRSLTSMLGYCSL